LIDQMVDGSLFSGSLQSSIKGLLLVGFEAGCSALDGKLYLGVLLCSSGVKAGLSDGFSNGSGNWCKV